MITRTIIFGDILIFIIEINTSHTIYYSTVMVINGDDFQQLSSI